MGPLFLEMLNGATVKLGVPRKCSSAATGALKV